MTTLAFLYTSGTFGTYCHPVTVLSRGPKLSRVRLRYAASFCGKRHKRGAVLRVPSHAVGGCTWEAFYAEGRGVYRRYCARHRVGLLRRYLHDLGMFEEADRLTKLRGRIGKTNQGTEV